MITYLYWIHYPSHTDPFTQGYIGITNKPKARINYHKNQKYSDNPILLRAIGRGACFTVIGCFIERNDALLSESKYRPHEKIGWNIIPGGIAPPSQKGRSNNSVRISNMTRGCSQLTRERMSASRKGMKWYTDGVNDRRAHSCPVGFYPGRTKQPPPPPIWKGKRKLAV